MLQNLPIMLFGNAPNFTLLCSKSWTTSADAPTKLIYALQHQYTQVGLAFNGLKNRDCAVAQVLRTAGRETELDIHLMILTKRDSGSAEENYHHSYKKHCGYQNSKHWSMCDDFESGVNNESKSFSEMEVDEESELLTESPFDDRKPNGIEVEECSGNEGTSTALHCAFARLVATLGCSVLHAIV